MRPMLSPGRRGKLRPIGEETAGPTEHCERAEDVVHRDIESVRRRHTKDRILCCTVALPGAKQKIDDAGVGNHDSLGHTSAPGREHDVR